MAKMDFRQLGMGVASITFGVALVIFIQAVILGMVSSIQTLLLYITSFLLMIRFWWRYTKLFIQYLPSQNFWQFLLDFAVSFFGILAVLFITDIQIWAVFGASAMLASMLRCASSWKVKKKNVKKSLRSTAAGAGVMLAALSSVYLLTPVVSDFILTVSIFMLTTAFVVYASFRE